LKQQHIGITSGSDVIYTSSDSSQIFSNRPKHHTYLVTGGSGSLGTAITTLLLAEGHKVRALARNEHRLAELEQSIPISHRPNLSCLPGAVEDLPRLKRAMAGVDYVIHAAAMKRIDSCEYSPVEAIRTNIEGTRNVIDACIDAKVSKAVLVSSDKARAPSTLYGASKLCAERLWLAANRYLGDNGGIFTSVAYGNVWGSKGSVLHAFQSQSSTGALQVTDPRCTRFHITLDDAVKFVLLALRNADPGTLWIPRLPSYHIADLAHAFSAVYSLPAQPVVIGRRPGEKVNEDLVAENESQSVKLEDTWHFVVEPGVIHQKGGWRFCSDSDKSPKLTVEELIKAVRQWAGRS
jgi:UDP-N-acetylglucosamine 4,6-dehydratase